MSQPPDISAILAALAAQRSSATPQTNQQAPPPPPGMYPGIGSSSTPSNGAGAFSLPQPSNSGSLDLSSIKPSNAGSVSLADAIAKAKSISADKARDDPRMSGRSYNNRRSRSRSRSPVRRDNYRDNYNPYRDERRDETQRAANGRDRSYSPNAQNRAQFSPTRGYHGRERSPIGRTPLVDGNSEIITVDSNSVGLIIGRGGENLKRVEGETGARVQFISGPESAGPQRQCKISGTALQREEAKREIFRVVDENPNAPPRGGQQRAAQSPLSITNQPPLREGERTMQIMVPDRTVGLIIGRGGETIRDLQERSGCHVNIVGENKSINGLRPVNLIGSREAAAKAKDLILEIVESDTRVGGASAAQQPPPTRQPDPYNPYPPAAGYDAYSSGGVVGGASAAQTKVNDSVVVPSEAVGMIIGKGGETIKEMQNTTGCKINVSPPSGADINREIGLIGTRMAIENAKRAIWDKVGTVREKQGGRRGGPPESAPTYGDPYSQYQQPPQYSQQQLGPPMPQAHSAPPAAGPEMAPSDPYAAYGGYQNYLQMWYAAVANQQGGQGPPPQV